MGCQSHRPPIGEIVIDTDLPPISEEPLAVGLTLDLGSDGKDLLSPNLLVNGAFELAPILQDCRYVSETKTLITPNGYSTFYPIPEQLYGWSGRSGEVSLSNGRTFYKESSHYLTFRPKDTDSVPCRIFATGYPLEVLKGEEYSLTCFISSDLAELSLSLVRDTLTRRPVSNTQTLRGDVYWRRKEVHFTITEDADSAYLMLESKPLLSEKGSFPYLQPRGYVSIDELWLSSRSESGAHQSALPPQLLSLLKRLDPDFVRFPGGRTANGYYTGSYPVPHYGRPDTLALWTFNGAEYTGHFGLPQLIEVSEVLSARPMLIANSGITDPTASPRYEELAKIDDRAKYLARLAVNTNLLLQIGYDMSSEEYKRRFHLYASKIDQDNLVAACSLVDSTTHFSDYVYDLALTEIRDPHLLNLLPPPNRSLQTQRQKLMVGEATFAAPSELEHFLPPLAQRAAFLIEAERYTPLFEGVGISPLLSTSAEKSPMILVRGAHYHATRLYDFVKSFVESRGTYVHPIEGDKDICLSLTSDADRKRYYLKAVNLTRHPLSYTVSIKGQQQSLNHASLTRFAPTVSSTTSNLSDYDEYSIRREPLSLQMRKGFTLTLEPYEAVIIDLHSSLDAGDSRIPPFL